MWKRRKKEDKERIKCVRERSKESERKMGREREEERVIKSDKE
jgi:hypothetical protein